jgi:hypothetical protein
MSALIQVRGRACTAKTADTNVPCQPPLGEKLLDIEVAELFLTSTPVPSAGSAPDVSGVADQICEPMILIPKKGHG